jgi:hypothetical protein
MIIEPKPARGWTCSRLAPQVERWAKRSKVFVTEPTGRLLKEPDDPGAEDVRVAIDGAVALVVPK